MFCMWNLYIHEMHKSMRAGWRLLVREIAREDPMVTNTGFIVHMYIAYEKTFKMILISHFCSMALVFLRRSCRAFFMAGLSFLRWDRAKSSRYWFTSETASLYGVTYVRIYMWTIHYVQYVCMYAYCINAAVAPSYLCMYNQVKYTRGFPRKNRVRY